MDKGNMRQIKRTKKCERYTASNEYGKRKNEEYVSCKRKRERENIKVRLNHMERCLVRFLCSLISLCYLHP